MIHLVVINWCILAKLRFQPRIILRIGPLGYLALALDSISSLFTSTSKIESKSANLTLRSGRFLNSNFEPNWHSNFGRMVEVVQIENWNRKWVPSQVRRRVFRRQRIFCSTYNSQRRVADRTLPSSVFNTLSAGHPNEVPEKCNNKLPIIFRRRKLVFDEIRQLQQRPLNPMILDALIPLETVKDTASPPVELTGSPTANETSINTGID